jgi:hypothetical protein
MKIFRSLVKRPSLLFLFLWCSLCIRMEVYTADYSICIMKLTLWSWALLQRPLDVRPLNSFPAFHGTRRFNTEFTRALHLFLSWARPNPVHITPSHLLTFQVLNLISIFHSLGRLSKESVQVRGSLEAFVTSFLYGEGLLNPRPTPSWRTTPCYLSTTAYSIYSQLMSIAGGRSSIRNPRTRHAVGTETLPLNF